MKRKTEKLEAFLRRRDDRDKELGENAQTRVDKHVREGNIHGR